MDLSISWKPGDNKCVFEKSVIVVQNDQHIKNDLNLDVVNIYKTTTIRSVAEFIFSKCAFSNTIVEASMNFVLCCLLYALSPKNSTILFFEENEFRAIDNLFQMKRGEKFILKEDLGNLNQADKVLEVLKENGILKEGTDRYYIKGHILKNLKIDKIYQPIK